jgi:DNA-directed RNA polymerase specialized sigma24 family protein
MGAKMEKQSKYITKYTDVDNPKYGTFTRRNILLSLPRVKWLDRQPDYTPWPELPTIVQTEDKPERKPTRCTFRPHTRSNQLTPLQQQAWDLHCQGLSHAKISVEMNKSTNAIGKLLAQAREKLGIDLK